MARKSVSMVAPQNRDQLTERFAVLVQVANGLGLEGSRVTSVTVADHRLMPGVVQVTMEYSKEGVKKGD